MYSLSAHFLLFISFAQQLQLSKSQLDVCESGRNDVIFLVDTSTSIQESNRPDQTTDNWSYIISFIKQIVDGFTFNTDPKLRVGIIPFSTKVDETFDSHLYDDKNTVLSRLEDVRKSYAGGNTNISGALRQARLTFDNNRYGGRRQIVVLITDGQSNVDENLTLTTAKENRDANITHFVVAITPYVNRLELQEIISRDPTFFYFEVELFENLNNTVKLLLDRINCPVPPSNGCKEVKADICFLLDSSGSIAQDDKKNFTDWNLMKAFLLDVVDSLEFQNVDYRISLIEFSETAETIFSLDYSISPDVIKTKISDITFFGSTTNTQDALMKMYKEVFVKSKGDRPDVPNVGIVITDGRSNEKQNRTIPEADIAKSQGIRIFAIGLTSSIEVSELNAIASLPTEQHVFTRNTISVVKTVVDNLVFNLCHATCFINCTNNRCPSGSHLAWNIYPDKMIQGRDYHQISGVRDIVTCQNNCLQEESCRSIEFVMEYNICNLSVYMIANIPKSEFINATGVEYRELYCQTN